MATKKEKAGKAGAKSTKAAVKSAKPAKVAAVESNVEPNPDEVSEEAQPVEKVAKTKTSKQSKEPKEKTPREIIEKVLESPLEVFNRKDLTKKSTKIGKGATVLVEKLHIPGPTGSELVRVKRANSPRTYYTTEEILG